MDRRHFLATAAAALAAPALSRVRGRPGLVVNPRSHGARGDGRTDDTDAFGRATEVLARAGGGTIAVDRGTYLIDPDYEHGRAIRLPSNATLQLASDARLRAIGGSLTHSTVVYMSRVSNAHVTGGTIEGERHRHTGTAGEWAYGVLMYTVSGCSVRGTRLLDCWGDGILVGAPTPTAGTESVDITIDGVTCQGNRRQGMSVIAAKRVTITGSTFSDTLGTPPSAGIDFEPDAGTSTVEDCTVRGCSFLRNEIGLKVATRSRRITVQDNVFRDNRLVGIHIADEAAQALVANNTIVQSDPRSYGILVESHAGSRLLANSLRGRFVTAIKLGSHDPNAVSGNVIARGAP